jgi:hypothetical protein
MVRSIWRRVATMPSDTREMLLVLLWLLLSVVLLPFY